ncbi:MAG TPA: lipoate--protein ligase family protein [Opitutaceae bacterium]
MNLEILPVRTAGAAENMAVDFLMLRRYPRPEVARYRHYEWRGPAFTFGYSQKFGFVRAQVPADVLDICRRPTGGGLVDHSEDWTYALVIPRAHALWDARASECYRAVHECLAAALAAKSVPAVVKKSAEPATGGEPAGVCFQQAELFDVMHASSGVKIAGAAQKRTGQGMLLQGSVWRPACGGAVDWDAFGEAFESGLASLLGAKPAHPGWPEWNEDEETALTEQYASPEWNEQR